MSKFHAFDVSLRSTLLFQPYLLRSWLTPLPHPALLSALTPSQGTLKASVHNMAFLVRPGGPVRLRVRAALRPGDMRQGAAPRPGARGPRLAALRPGPVSQQPSR